MEHLIRFKTPEGIDGTHAAESLDDAVAFAERVRNAEGATDVRLYRLTEIPIEFKPYYRVEVGAPDRAGDALWPTSVSARLDPPATEHPGTEQVATDVPGTGQPVPVHTGSNAAPSGRAPAGGGDRVAANDVFPKAGYRQPGLSPTPQAAGTEERPVAEVEEVAGANGRSLFTRT